jgi:uncharacterized OsmC-like protein
MKKVQVQATMGNGFETTCRVGNHTVTIDQPANAGGRDKGPSPLDLLLVSYAGCLAALGRIIAMQRRIALRGMEIEVTGELDPSGLLGKSTEGPIGFPLIEARVTIDADLSGEEKSDLLLEIERRCPVSDNLSHATTVRAVLAS